jgi:hypothetical protein
VSSKAASSEEDEAYVLGRRQGLAAEPLNFLKRLAQRLMVRDFDRQVTEIQICIAGLTATQHPESRSQSLLHKTRQELGQLHPVLICATAPSQP